MVSRSLWKHEQFTEYSFSWCITKKVLLLAGDGGLMPITTAPRDWGRRIVSKSEVNLGYRIRISYKKFHPLLIVS